MKHLYTTIEWILMPLCFFVMAFVLAVWVMTETPMQDCIDHQIKQSQVQGYEADQFEVTEYCEARTK